jgi:hypothetical protein
VTLDFDVPRVSVPLQVRWTRRQDETSWICGGTIPEYALPQWRDLIAVLT